MAHLLRLIALALVFIPGIAWANIYPSEAEARSACEAARLAAQTAADNYGHGTTWACVETTHEAGTPLVIYPAVCNKVVAPSPSGCQETFAWENAPDPCEDLAGTAANYWFTAQSWPPSGIGCMDSPSPATDAQNCATIVDVLSSPIANADGTFQVFAQVTWTGASCSPQEIQEENLDQVPEEDAGEGWTCDPETGLCTDPQGNGKLCTFNPDGSRSACVDYKPGDGTEPAPQPDPNENPDDPRDTRTASGGGACSAAPACSGDPIDCAQLWQQWKTRCALEKHGSVSGAACVNGAAVQLNCTNMDAARCFDLQMQTEAACRLAALAGDGDDEIDWGGADQGMGTEYTAAQGWADGQGGAGGPTIGDLDDSGFLGGSRSCPTVPTVSVFGTTLTFDIAPLCGFLGIGSQLVLLFAALAAARIIGTAI